jgi:hypothetical protein
MENQDSNSNAKLTSFSQDEATTNVENTNIDNNSKKSDNLANKEVVTRPLLWGLVVFLVFFGFVIGAVSVYRVYSVDEISQTINTPSTPTPTNSTSPVLNNTPVSADTTKEANIVESEIKVIDSDLEGEIYSDESLGL